MDDIYRENILDNYRHPKNFGKLVNADIEEELGNPFCGDKIAVSLKLTGTHKQGVDRKVRDIRFNGQGCAVSIASASLVTEYIKGKSLREIMALNRETVLSLMGIELTPTRLKCALLSLETVQNAVKQTFTG
ncbi:hypothetical protein A3D05_00945 [Candidatus Gottesmanbacteria bacterium RIFCSPHIGHO2_02_FULL_40_24]|uniref:NIF system FeS cluster assembly NifU N-terminal domain-containing protein n=1 Tax=Candidatus Gottesmanbacteria bacterium RIFCSPHIGHO2_01_FULL_40_15 TaxID=1798376 RepID=A0A1F5YZW6_9BACT|nr:MAG: hypothetical protein A2777_05125 [Candidatus Gottesmanbacteria bacterium RIFCSPHIGHO2_01_FULL_40_15]OGG18304.1 MAG: hypothetical protein A3D05_00945 [Candidatus Gottesmanbacteria bacterium RIFCSPHIGHO2_02_FULL_40_24]OGG22454.1 MAG: hypothetical protein A3B48_04205 [Candidatus Gottesmanbacteria bacterium RIFCSPLOWO2_01_FULL_40_10]OGG24861.1 MAG: hypothetical protein A3E42_02030 [Candidatus Gottesmanbacteria bacterium RIFCSPHIGHO2_12_FULL_40_13]OGG33698.1 MAG: hypothetical protein A3I80_0